MKVSNEEVDAAYAVLCEFMSGPTMPVTKVLAVDMLKDALKVRKRLKREREIARELA